MTCLSVDPCDQIQDSNVIRMDLECSWSWLSDNQLLSSCTDYEVTNITAPVYSTVHGPMPPAVNQKLQG